ncbi:TPA: hypothetical protein RO394_002600 [Escherichia coli]|nr:hypothetical protein [Escherichia coli]
MILVITSSFDKTIDYIVKKHSINNFYRLDVDNFSEYKFSYTKKGFSIVNKNNNELLESECRSIYYRKPTPENIINKIDSKYHNHCFREVFAFVEGIAESFTGKCLSKPSIIKRADNKVLQAKTAIDIGFTIPDFILTNNFDCFKNTLTINSIVKPLSSGLIENQKEKEFVQTNMVDMNKNTETLKYCPTYFQSYTKKEFEVRSTFINGKDYSVKITSKNKIDWRKNNNEIFYSTIKMPDTIKEKCLRYMSVMNISFGCFDFIVFDGEWFFLEMNANGQWAWLENETNINVSSELVRFLNEV